MDINERVAKTTTDTRGNKTGSWRTMRPLIDSDKCVFCEICWALCSENCIQKKDETIGIDLNYCKGCGVCAEECPRNAIEMKPEVECHE